MKEEAIEVTGVVTAVLQKHQYSVLLDNTDHTVFATLNGRCCKNRIWLTVGDKCLGEMSQYDLTKLRVTRRL
jgi:translation initiation factor IF-1